MSRYEYVETAIWGDPTFQALPPQAKVLYFWSFTNPHCNLAGLYKASVPLMRVETGLTAAAFRKAVDALRVAHLVYIDHPLIWVRARVKYLHTRNESVARSIHKDLANLDQRHQLVQSFLFTYSRLDWLTKELRDFTIPAANPLIGLRDVSPEQSNKGAINGVV